MKNSDIGSSSSICWVFPQLLVLIDGCAQVSANCILNGLVAELLLSISLRDKARHADKSLANVRYASPDSLDNISIDSI